MNKALSHLQNKKVFVGGYGFYGSWMRNILACHNIEVECGSRHLNGWDIMNPSTYTPFQLNADYVINCAGRADILGDAKILGRGPAMMCNQKKRDTVFLQVSSGIVGRKGNTPYALAKRYSEHTLKEFKNVKIVRPFATVGPLMGLDKSFAISTFIKKTLEGEPLEVAPNVKRSFCHIQDLIEQMLHVLVFGDNEPYEVGSDDMIDLEDAAKVISSSVFMVENKFPSNSCNEYVADLSRIRQEFNLTLNYSSLEAVRETFNWYENNNS